MPKIKTKVTYLEMKSFSGGQCNLNPPRTDTDIVRAKNPSVAFYRFLFEQIGKRWQWVSRKAMTDSELEKIIHDPKNEIFVNYVGGVPAGYVELDVRKPEDIELVFIGLTSEFLGQGLGSYLMDWTLSYVWNEKQPKRFWLHTCELDSPKALELYYKLGFTKYEERIEEVDTDCWQ